MNEKIVNNKAGNVEWIEPCDKHKKLGVICVPRNIGFCKECDKKDKIVSYPVLTDNIIVCNSAGEKPNEEYYQVPWVYKGVI